MNDLISRQAAILQLSHNKCGNDENDIAVQHDIETIRALPSAQLERKTGRWVDSYRSKLDGTRYWFRQCDQCLYERDDCDPEKDTKFCPDCGADMRGEQEWVTQS